ncbi:MAG TPA: glycine zipper 2TM domain-containing protein [Pseudoduganella sp.]
MEPSTNPPVQQLHPLVVTAAAAVTVVSLLGVAAITGLYPSSHGKAMPDDTTLTTTAQGSAYLMPTAPAIPNVQSAASAPLPATPTRFQTADGRVFEEVPSNAVPPNVTRVPVYAAARLAEPAPVIHRKVVHHYTQSARHEPSYRDSGYRESADREPAYVQERSYHAQHPVQTYVNDMNPVGTGIGAVIGGVLGNQIGGGNGKKLATVAGVLLGGYAGNEVAHDRNPLPFGNR